MIHIVSEKVNKLIVYPQFTIGGVVGTNVIISQINILNLSLKTHSGHLCSSSKFTLISSYHHSQG